ncbi:MAG: DNA polymerase I [Planctomycetota bacterium]
MAGSAAKRLFLIDGTALAYRAHFAFATAGPRGGLSTKDGRPTSAIYGFTTTLNALLEREQPDAVVVSFDGPHADLARTKVYAEYKSTREKMPDELVWQLDIIEQVVNAYDIPIVRSREHEADDIIGTLAVQAREAGIAAFIVTSDKDFMQLVGPRIRLWNLRASTRAPEIIGPAEVEAKFGVRPERMVDLLALMGDASDNIPGVPKVGPKTAAQLLADHGDLDTVLAHAADVKRPALRQALLDHADDARLSRRLVLLHTEVDTGIDVAGLTPPKPQRAPLETLFRELEFESLLKALPAEEQPEIATEYRVVEDEAALDALLARIQDAGAVALALEATGSDPLRTKLVGIAFSLSPGEADYVPLNAHPPVLRTGADAVLERMRPVLEDTTIAKASADAKRDLGVLRNAGVALGGLRFDTMLASYCVAPNLSGHDLDALALRHYSHRRTSAKPDAGTKKQKTFAEVDVTEVGRGAGADADFALRLRERLAKQLAEHEVSGVFTDLELPLVPVLLDMEREGIAIDVGHLEQLATDLSGRLGQLEEAIYALAGEPFNVNSPAQVGEVMFARLELHKSGGNVRPKRTRTGQFKTDAATLEALAQHHEVPRRILEYRQLAKLKGTYVDSLPKLVNSTTGRVHTTFNQAVAATGRLSSDNPNLQNIPIRTEEGRNVRRAFVSRAPDWVLLSADYSQIELRILAHLSGDETLIESFRNDEDIHARTAALVHGLAPDAVTTELRTQAKAINYGLMYGMGASRLARETGMTPPEAKQFINAYFKALPGVKRLLDHNLETAREQREVRTMFGRRRPLPEIDSTNAMQRVAAENMAVNTPIQGAAADIIKRAMLAVHARLQERQLQARLLLQVHDELVLDVPEAELPEVRELLADAMRGAADLDAPLEVTMGHGRNWIDAH